jgi:GDP-D-mannose dehydratase
MESELNTCRICKSSHFTEVVNLGKQIITSRFPDFGDYSTPSTKVRLVMCNNCKLVQLKDTTDSSELYEYMYGYRSGLNATMRNHLKDYNSELQKYVELKDGDAVLDIGSNDGTFLHCYDSKLKRVGCDPTGKQFIEFYGDLTLVPTYFTKNNIQESLGKDICFKAVSSISMFYDLPDPVQFAKDIHDVLDKDGIWTLEQSYVVNMLERNSIDTICHEHLEYYGVKQIKEIMDRSGFKIIHISKNECNGGSFRIFVAKTQSQKYKEAVELIQDYLMYEQQTKIHTIERYIEFNKSCKDQVDKLTTFIKMMKQDGKKVYIYGASTKGNCLLQYGNIGPELIEHAVERNPQKVGKMTSTCIEIISEETMRKNPPAFLLVLPWHFRKEIIEREDEFLSNGGQFIFPFPTFEIYSKKQKVLITGIDGQIAHYVIEKMSNSCIYGITNSIKKSDKQLFKIQNNLMNESELENILISIKPDVLIHLASISNTEDCENNALDTLKVNGMAIGYICDILHRNNIACKVFNSSSSENYKGHATYTVTENDTNQKPLTLYSIAKSFSQNVVEYYRKTYNMHVSNGILFTTESPFRKNRFLVKKIAEHAKQWTNTHTVLHLGSLESFRNINHASDVADAINLIVNNDKSDDYLICGNNHYKVEDIVVRLYELNNIKLVKKDNIFYEQESMLPVIEVGQSLRNAVTDINGNSTKLFELGWKPVYTLDLLLKDILEKC